MSETYYYGQGRVFARRRTMSPGGVLQLGPQRWVGDVSALSLAVEVESINHRESYSGKRRKVRNIVTGEDATVTMTWHQLDNDNLELTLYGQSVTVPGGSVTGQALPTLAAGQRVSLPHRAVSDVAIDGLTLDEHYRVDAAYGAIDILALPVGFDQPASVAYQYGTRRQTGILSAQAPEILLRYEGINLAEGGAPVLVELWRVSTAPLAELALINTGTELAGMEVTGEILADTSRPHDGALGQLGMIETVVVQP